MFNFLLRREGEFYKDLVKKKRVLFGKRTRLMIGVLIFCTLHLNMLNCTSNQQGCVDSASGNK